MMGGMVKMRDFIKRIKHFLFPCEPFDFDCELCMEDYDDGWDGEDA